MLRVVPIVMVVSLFVAPLPARAQAGSTARALTVVSAGPTGEVASLAEANEVRLVFSEPMVTLGRIPSPVRAPFFSISPAVAGTFRWSGTTILVFTPDAKKPLPFATRYTVTVGAGATAVSGRTLARPYTFEFTTPTTKLLQTHWYRRGGKAGAQMVMVLKFNQRVRSADVLAHLTAAFERHDWDAPVLPASANTRLRQMDPQAPAAFEAKVAATRAVTQASAPVGVRLATDWDRKRFPPVPSQVVLETTTEVPPESWVRIAFDEQLPSPAGTATPSSVQSYTIQVENAFFVAGFRCTAECDPDAWNPIRLRSDVTATDFAAGVKATEWVSATTARTVTKPSSPAARRENERDQGNELTLEDAGFAAQPPSRTYAVTVDATLQISRRPDAGLHLERHGDELAPARVHQLRRRPRRLGERAAAPSCRSTRATFRTSPSGRRRSPSATLMPTLLKLQPAFAQTPGGDGQRAPSRRHRRSHPCRTGSTWAAPSDPRRKRAGMGRRPGRRADRQVEAFRRQPRACVDRPGHEPRDHRQGQPAEHAGVRYARSTTGAPVPGAKVSIVTARQPGVLERHDRRGRCRVAPSTPLRNAEDSVEVRIRRDRRKGRRRRLRRQRLERRDRAVGLRLALQPQRSGAAAARHGLQRSRRVPARRGSDVQGGAAAQLGGRYPHAAGRHAALRQHPRQPGSRRRRAIGAGERVEQRRVDAHAPGRGHARELQRSRDARERPAEAASRRRSCARARRRAAGRRAGAVYQSRSRVVPRRRLSPA